MNALTPVIPASPAIPVIPENAPFSPAQRAWLNGFLAGLYSGAAAQAGTTPAAAPAEPAEDFPWHDPAIELEERLAMAEGRPLNRRLMAAMAQLDCGQCGYVCQSYAEALAGGQEGSASLCVPGGKATMKALKALMAEAPAAPPPAPAVAAKPKGEFARFAGAVRLTAPASAKDVRHVVLDLAGTGLRYEPGDSFGILAPNDPGLVAAVAGLLGTTPEQTAQLADTLDIARPLDRTLDLLAGAARNPAEAAALRRLSDGEDGAEPADADLLDLLEAFPSARPPVADLLASLPALKPRLYSIASSPLACPERVELCVSVVRATRRGRVRDGVASCHLGHRSSAEVPLLCHVQSSHFRLPADAATPIIMVGPGTGIAPFRAFLQHRQATAATGPSWLFFGDQHAATDFLFREEIEAWRQDRTLHRLSLAWSRDQAKKIYVQDRMREHAADLWRWLQDGAHFYVCGDALRMARDVDTALRDIAREQGRMDAEQARDWIVALARQGRYQRDVY